VLAGAIRPELVAALIGPIVAAAVVLLAGMAVLSLWQKQRGAAEHPRLQIKNPFELGTVLQLAGLIAAILLLAKLVAGRAGNAGLFSLAAISGIADVDALTLSMARLSGVEVARADAATAILVAASVNTASKAALAAFVGGVRLGTIVAIVSVLAIGALGVTFLILR
jgi:uncharacterized membrane protein (DUF4010 family)